MWRPPSIYLSFLGRIGRVQGYVPSTGTPQKHVQRRERGLQTGLAYHANIPRCLFSCAGTKNEPLRNIRHADLRVYEVRNAMQQFYLVTTQTKI